MVLKTRNPSNLPILFLLLSLAFLVLKFLLSPVLKILADNLVSDGGSGLLHQENIGIINGLVERRPELVCPGKSR